MTVGARIKDVARRAGVSIGTVSNVLNRPHIVAPGTRTRVMAAIAELGFVRNESARQLRSGVGRTVGLVVLDVGNPFYADVTRGVERAAAGNDVVVTLCNTGESEQQEYRNLNVLEQLQVLGVLLCPVSEDEDRVDAILRSRTPVVLVDFKSRGDRCSVSVDNEHGGCLAVRHLLESGHTTVAFISGPLTIRQGKERLQGARQAMFEDGRPSDSLRVLEMPSYTVASGRRAAVELVALQSRPTAVFCANDLLAIGMLQGLFEQGLSVPNDVAIVGYDDIEFAGAAAVPLSSVRQPREEIGAVAVDLVLGEVEQAADHRHRQVIFEPELIVRRSSMSG